MPETKGMHLEKFKEEDRFIKARVAGVQGHWEDAAALMWATEMKRQGLEPYRDDPEWNKLVDSKGNRLYGTKKSRINGLWLKWKKPEQASFASFAESTVSDELAEALTAAVGRETERSDVWDEDPGHAGPTGTNIWDHPAIEDLFLDGFFKREGEARPCLPAFTSSVILAIHALEGLAAKPHTDAERGACAAVLAALGELLAILGALPGPSDLLSKALALARRFLPARAAAAAGVEPRTPGGGALLGGVFGGRDEGLVGAIERVVRGVRELPEGGVLMAPAGWVRPNGTGRIMVPAPPMDTHSTFG